MTGDRNKAHRVLGITEGLGSIDENVAEIEGTAAPSTAVNDSRVLRAMGKSLATCMLIACAAGIVACVIFVFAHIYSEAGVLALRKELEST